MATNALSDSLSVPCKPKALLGSAVSGTYHRIHTTQEKPKAVVGLRKSLGLPTLADRYITDLCGLQHSRFVASKVFFTCSKREDEEDKDEQARPGE